MPLLNHKFKKNSPLTISVAGRASPLSRIQIQEILSELQQFYPAVQFEVNFVTTKGDHDQQTSLRSLGQTDFFTYEIDQMVLSQTCRIGIHSAKDLPFPLPEGLKILCLTKGVAAFDALVLREEETVESLPFGACIATCSLRREESVRALRNDFTFKDVRGTICQRLSFLDNKQADGVVIAEAALIRLGLTHRNRIQLHNSTTPYQGQLAVVGHIDDQEMQHLFTCLDTR